MYCSIYVIIQFIITPKPLNHMLAPKNLIPLFYGLWVMYYGYGSHVY
jgi:hypothetical protein